MFRCDGCKRTTDPGEKQTKMVVETRPRTYEEQSPKGRVTRSYGTEIVRSLNMGPCCAGDKEA